MKERPILFTSDMVKAILDGRKTEARLLRGLEEINENPDWWQVNLVFEGRAQVNTGLGPCSAPMKDMGIDCPNGKPGARLWVQEAFEAIYGESEFSPSKNYQIVKYLADNKERKIETNRLSAHCGYCASRMPRWASRLLLEVTEIKVERVQEIDGAGAVAEGLPAFKVEATPKEWADPRKDFAHLWDSINKKRGFSWESNPWVWVVKFKVIEKRGE